MNGWMCHTTCILLRWIGFLFLPSKETHFCLFYKDSLFCLRDISHFLLAVSSRCASRGLLELAQGASPFGARECALHWPQWYWENPSADGPGESTLPGWLSGVVSTSGHASHRTGSCSTSELKLPRLLASYRRFDLILVDELGYLPFSKPTAELLFQFFSDRYERASVAITSNLAFAQWTQVFGNEQMTAALLDRLVHRSHILAMEGESFRFRQSLQQQDSQALTA